MYQTLLPLFVLIGCGYLAVKVKLVDHKALHGINMFVVYFALPALIIHFMASRSLQEMINLPFLKLFSLAAAILFVVSMLLCRYVLQTRKQERGVLALAGTWSNEGYLGIPFLLALLGDPGMKVALWAVFIDQVLSVGLATFFMETSKANSEGRSPLVNVLKGFAKSPFILTSVIGLTCSALPKSLIFQPLLQPFWHSLSLLGQAASPAALFAIGITLAYANLRGDMRTILSIASVKLLLHPLIILALGLWFKLEPTIFFAALLIAVLPSAGTAYAMAARYGVAEQRVSSIIFITTLASIPLIYLVISQAHVFGVALSAS